MPRITVAQGRARSRGLITFVTVALLFVAFLLHGFANSGRVIDRRTLVDPRVPSAFSGFRIVYLSDIHAGPFFGAEQLDILVEDVNRLDPDLIIIGGDNVGGQRDGTRIVYPALARMRAKYGRVAVLGNHDSLEGEATAVAGVFRSGFDLLDNRVERIRLGGSHIAVAGVEDPWTGAADVRGVAEEIDPREFAVLVTHNPDVLVADLPPTRDAWRLVLAGHNHGGQITVLGWAPWLPSVFGQRYRGGWLEEEGVPVLVSNGIGTVLLPIRFAAPSQIHVITLRRGASQSIVPMK